MGSGRRAVLLDCRSQRRSLHAPAIVVLDGADVLRTNAEQFDRLLMTTVPF
jgi:hypothetical protein